MTAQETRAKVKDNIGEKTKIHIFAACGMTVSLAKSFKASANGCNSPKNPTMFGPRRRCIAAITLRSNKVMKATEMKTGRTTLKVFNKSKITKENDIDI